LESERNAQLCTSLLQQRKQQLARESGEHVATTLHQLVLIIGVYCIPEHKTASDGLIGLEISLLERRERPIREDDAPTVRGVGRVALDNVDLPDWIGLLQQQATIQASGTGPEYGDFHWWPSGNAASAAPPFVCRDVMVEIRPTTSARRQ